MSAETRLFPIQGAPAIPWWVIAPHQGQALTNHGQSLETLASRGGLGPEEAIDVLRGDRWSTWWETHSLKKHPAGAWLPEAVKHELLREARDVLALIVGERVADRARAENAGRPIFVASPPVPGRLGHFFRRSYPVNGPSPDACYELLQSPGTRGGRAFCLRTAGEHELPGSVPWLEVLSASRAVLAAFAACGVSVSPELPGAETFELVDVPRSVSSRLARVLAEVDAVLAGAP